MTRLLRSAIALAVLSFLPVWSLGRLVPAATGQVSYAVVTADQPLVWQNSLKLTQEGSCTVTARVSFTIESPATLPLVISSDHDMESWALDGQPLSVPLPEMRYRTLTAIASPAPGPHVLEGTWNVYVPKDGSVPISARLEVREQTDQDLAITDGPMVNQLTGNSFTVTCRTTLPVAADLQVGGRDISSPAGLIHSFKVDGLGPGQAQRYLITAQSGQRKVQSGPYEVRTLPADGPLVFAAAGDWQSRCCKSGTGGSGRYGSRGRNRQRRQDMRGVLRAMAAVVTLGVVLISSAHAAAPAGSVVLYSSIDEPYVRPLVREFEQKTGMAVTLVTDSEATKTAGLVEKIQAEKASPKADVYWGNEPFHTITLAWRGVLTPYQSPAAAGIPARWHDKDWCYTSIGLRARVIAFSTRPEYANLVRNIKGMEDLTNPVLKGKVGVCHPGFGTASGHFAAMYLVLGEQKYTQLMQGLKANDIKLLGGNSVVADQVAAGTLAVGPTDNDDVANGKAEDQKIDGVLPDQGDGGMGTLLIPTTIGLVNGAPHAENGMRLIDFLLRPDVEKGLIEGRYCAYSVRADLKQVKAMDVDYAEVAANMRKATELALSILQQR